MKNLSLIILLLAYFTSQGFAQDRHLILFTDKDTSLSPEEFLSAKALQRRTKQGIAITNRDYPVDESYIQAVNSISGVTVIYPTKWLNGVLIEISTENQLNAIKSLPFVQQSSRLENLYGGTKINSVSTKTNTLDYGESLSQLELIGADQFHRQGITGKGMTIAVFDSGFPGVDRIDSFSHLIENNRIKGTYDFVENEIDVYDDHNHGTRVLSTMAAFQSGELIGTAYDANYYLFVTENVYSESPVEEFYWLVAAERADSVGVDIINSSLGYSTFDNAQYNYSIDNITGDHSIISQAADFAAATGILVVNSSGNAYSPWGLKLQLPADSDSVLTVGAVHADGSLASFSSRGPTTDGRIKPDVMAMGVKTVVANPNGSIGYDIGTSFSAPLMAGFAACIWQAFPHLTNMEIIDLLRNTGDQANSPDNSYGYGIPHYNRIVTILSAEKEIKAQYQTQVYPNPIQDGHINLSFDQNLLNQPISIQLFDMKGTKLIEQHIQVATTPYTLKIEYKPNITYMLVVMYQDHYETFKIIGL